MMIAQIDREMLRLRPGKVIGRLVAYGMIEGRPLTTRGRWINPLVFAGYGASQVLPQVKSVAAPIFVIGTGRSGTTVLGKLFAMHRQTVFLNEPKALWHFAHGAEDMIGSYTDRSARVRLANPEEPDAMARKIARVYGWALAWSGAERVVDKYPELVFRIDFVKSLFPDARFVCIARDGVDTAASVTSWSKRNGVSEQDETHDWWGRNDRKWRMLVDEIVPEHGDLAPFQDGLRANSHHLDRAAVEWIVSMREARRQGERHADDVLTIAYEALCAAPAETLRTIYAHCGLEDDAVAAGYAETIMEPAPDRGQIALAPEIVEPFIQTLREMDYAQSVERVTARL